MSFITSLKEIDTELFLFLNSKHNAFFDSLMFWASNKFIWIPMYAALLFLVIAHFKKNFWLPLIFGILLIAASDQLSVHAFKDVFLRYRPCHNLAIRSQVHLNNVGCGGLYGFISSHAANTFALAMFLYLLFRGKIKRFGFFIFFWASLVTYSRIYNGVHYPADIACGAIVGMGVAVVMFKIYQRASLRFDDRGEE